MVSFIDMHRGEHGVEPICNVLPIVPSTYYHHLAKRFDPTRMSDRARRDEALQPLIRRVFEENWRVYGFREVWRQLGRENIDVVRCTVARLMRDKRGRKGIGEALTFHQNCILDPPDHYGYNIIEYDRSIGAKRWHL